MTFTNKKYQAPKSLKLAKPVDEVKLSVSGQGVLLFTASELCTLTYCDVSGTPGLKVQFTDGGVFVNLEPSNEPLVSETTKGLVSNKDAQYWFSLDSQNQRLYAGVGEARKETAFYSYEFPNEQNKKLFLESLVSVKVDHLQVVRVLRDPITGNVPLLVKNTDDLMMDHVASAIYMPKANLSLTSQKLYDCISGKQFTLNTSDFPEFAQAIEHSIATPGKWCHELLKKKATEFDKDKPNDKETYLRITLGENNGESPGIPYVMEIWPVGHYSPVHNHGGASAVIRVLHGSINVSLFPYLGAVEPFGQTNFKKEDVTWISPELNQVHQLKNLEGNKDTCITIQCYMYEDDDTKHYDYFDYLDADGAKQQFEPNSDMGFVEFKKLMKKEWEEFQVTQPRNEVVPVRRNWFGC
jgi:predicted metal-dependent enzyme (double-stranded beta helix superfamily)